MTLEDSRSVGNPTRVLLKYPLGFAPAELNEHGALGLVHLKFEGLDRFQESEDQLVCVRQVSPAADGAVHREIIRFPCEEALDSVPASESVQEAACQHGKQCGGKLTALFDANCGFNMSVSPLGMQSILGPMV